MANDVTLTCRLNKASLPVMNTQQLAYVLIEAVPGAGMAQVQMPLNLSLVLDKSGSMSGKKIQNLRQAAKLVVDRLGPEDTISIVAFSDRKYLIAKSQPVVDQQDLKRKIDRIRDGGGTAISGGMGQGLAELAKALSPDRVSRMLLLTDGQTFGDEKQCLKQGKKAGASGIVVNALGLGDDWNEDLLDDIAEASGGVADFIDSPDKIVAFFEQAVKSMQDTVVQNAQLVLRLASGVTPRQVWQVLPMISNLGYRPLSDRDVQVTLGELEKGHSRSLLVELLISPRPAGSYRIAQAELGYDVPGLKLIGEKIKTDIMLDFSADALLAKQVRRRRDEHRRKSDGLQIADPGFGRSQDGQRGWRQPKATGCCHPPPGNGRRRAGPVGAGGGREPGKKRADVGPRYEKTTLRDAKADSATESLKQGVRSTRPGLFMPVGRKGGIESWQIVPIAGVQPAKEQSSVTSVVRGFHSLRWLLQKRPPHRLAEA